MRQLTYVEPHRLEWWEVDDRELDGGGHALVRPLAVATCDLDAAIVRGLTPFPPPFPFGHECVAEVAEVGDELEGLRPGQLVSVPFQLSCGECEPCARGHDALCERTPPLANYGMGESATRYGGMLSDLVHVPYAQHMLLPLPDGVDPVSVASLSDNVPDAWRTVGPPLAERPGATVLVVGGSGSIDLYAAGLAVALGAGQVDYLSSDAWRLEVAASLGANPLEGTIPKRLGPYGITVDASGGNEDGLRCALRSTEPEGISTSVGIYFQPETPVPLLEMYTKGITFHTGVVHARPAMPPVLELIAAGRFKPELVTRQLVAWDDAAEALRDHVGKHVIAR
jgi:alcohol dehydrogenase